jgi:beta-galactosidase
MAFIHPQFWRSQYIGQKKDFEVDSNCDSVELKVNGRSFGILKPAKENFHVANFKKCSGAGRYAHSYWHQKWKKSFG